MSYARLLAALLLVPFLQSCLPSDKLVAPPEPGSSKRMQVLVGSTYDRQVFVDLTTLDTVLTVPLDSWNLCVSSRSDDHTIRLNMGLVASAQDAGDVPFDDVREAPATEARYDQPTGRTDSMAIGIWWNADGNGDGHVYVIHLGYDTKGKDLGFRKIQLLSAALDHIVLRAATLDGSSDTTITVAKDPLRRTTGIRLAPTVQVVTHEPPADTWDIVFTRYTHIFWEPAFTPYAVTGALVNTTRLETAKTRKTPFAAIDRAAAEAMTFTKDRDGIGYSWKSYDLNAGTYTIDTTTTYVIHDVYGQYTKLRFLDFYDSQGRTGAPLFDVAPL